MRTEAGSEGAIGEAPIGDVDGFWARWMSERPHFARMCRRWLHGRPHDVEDVLSLGAIKAVNFLRARPSEIRRFRPWALRILHNLCVDVLRAQGRGATETFDEDGACARVEVAATPTAIAPDRALYRGELARALERAVVALPPRLRVAFELRLQEGLSYAEMSEALAITQENARKRVQQARVQLRLELGEHAG